MSTLSTTNVKNASSGSNNIVLAADGSTTITTLTGTTITGTSVRGAITSGTVVASTSGTSIDFTSIPSYVKRITVMFDGVSLNGSSVLVVRLGTSGGFATTGYNTMLGTLTTTNNTTRGLLATTYFPIQFGGDASHTVAGNIVFTNLTSNTWTGTGIFVNAVPGNLDSVSGGISLGGALTQVRITTVSGTDTFDAGSINILYEG